MNTYTINEDKIKICLTDDEVKTLFGGYEMIDYDCPRSRAVLDSILNEALPESMLPLDCKKVLIEVREEIRGCTIQITRIYDKGKRLHKVNRKHEYILLFESSEDMINLILHLEKDKYRFFKNSILIKSADKFAIMFYGDGASLKNVPFLTEYGRLLKPNSPAAAKILEYGETVCENAVFKMIAAFKTKKEYMR